MKLLIRIQYLLAILFLVVGASFFLFNKYRHLDPPQLFSNQEFVRSVNSIQDIEHLRKLLFTVTINSDKALVADSEVINTAVSVGVAFCLAAAAAFFVCASQARKIAKSSGEGDGHVL
jgi:hypothetical protein